MLLDRTRFTDHEPVLTSHAVKYSFIIEKVQRRAAEMTKGMQRGVGRSSVR